MQYALCIDDRTQALVIIDYLLRKRFVLPRISYRLNPVSQLIKGIIGGKTRSEVSADALSNLYRTFGSCGAIRDAEPDAVLDAIGAVTHASKKVIYLQASLSMLHRERGQFSLACLDALSVPDAMRWLERYPGVGRKVSASVMNASTIHRRALVIDTHHLRILKRLRFVTDGCDFKGAYDRIMPRLPQGWCATRIDDHHRLFKRLGQTVCRPTQPHCGRCPLRDLCPEARETGAG